MDLNYCVDHPLFVSLSLPAHSSHPFHSSRHLSQVHTPSRENQRNETRRTGSVCQSESVVLWTFLSRLQVYYLPWIQIIHLHGCRRHTLPPSDGVENLRSQTHL
uniref:Uncharacterized protein n=1 Tax=Cacopsylla melanoneura TaxID=428564 RepID=A0A8D8LR41_9HEMI